MPPKLTRVDLVGLVRRVVDELELVARAREVRLESTLQVETIEADEELSHALW